MKNNFLKNIIILAVCLVTGFTAEGQRVLTLQEAINTALKSSFDIQIARNTLEADRINNSLAIAGGLPTVTGSLTDNESLTAVNQKTNQGEAITRNNAASNALAGGVTGSFLLFNGFRVIATKNRLAALESESEQQINIQVQNTIANVMLKYYDIVRQQTYSKTLAQSIEATRQRRDIAEARKSVGLANNADTWQAQIDLNASEQALLSQQTIVIQGKTDLMNLMSQTPDTSFIVQDTIIIDQSINYDSVKNLLRTNPEILAAAQNIRVNEFAEHEIAAQRYPAIRLTGGYNYSRNQSAAGQLLLNQGYGPFLGLNVQVPIFNAGVTKRQIRVAGLATRSAEVSQANVINDLESSAANAWYTLQSTLNQLEKERENYKLTGDLLNLTLQRYQLINATIIELREAQRSFEEAGYRLVNLSYSAKVAEIELKRISSQLGF